LVTFFLTLLGASVGLAAGFIAAAAIAYAVAGAMGVSDFEGGRGMLAFFLFGPIGGIVGLLLGVWLVLRLRGQRSLNKALGYGAAVVVSLVALASTTVVVLYVTGDILRPNQAPLQLDFEIRLPSRAAPQLDAIKVALNTDKNVMPADLLDRQTRQEGDRLVLHGRVDLYFRTSNRLLVLSLPAEPDRIFRLALSASPHLSDSYSPWTRVDFVAGTLDSPPRKAGLDDNFDIRYRVVDPTVQR
jgi:MFS family permease